MTDQITRFLNQLHHPTLASIDMSLDRMHRLLMMLGNPQNRLPPVLHIAGTNGKGSTLAYIQRILSVAGYRVHRYTSPHLMHFRERVELNGTPIENDKIESIIRFMLPHIQQQPVTFFEATTALAFLAFADTPADILLLETGLGGRLDATNVLAKPKLTAITPIDYDHTEYLGDTLTKIAGEKAGIIKPGIPVVVGKQHDQALQIIETTAKDKNSPLYVSGKDWQHKDNQYQSAKRTLTFEPSLAGDYQSDNAAMAIACLDQLDNFTLSDTQIQQGIASTQWPARLQHLKTGALAQLIPDNCELWLDGSHNQAGAENLNRWFEARKLPVYLVCGMIKDKDTKAFLTVIKFHVKRLIAVMIRDESNSKTAQQIQNDAKSIGIDAQSADSLENALKKVAEHVTTPSIIMICGSLYLAGKALAANKE